MRRTAPAPPVRIAHVGLGAFFRAHQAAYTADAADAEDWGIAAFTGRSPDAARALAAQDGLYHLVTRSADDDDVSLVPSVVAAYDGGDDDAWHSVFTQPQLAVVTLTITEAGYQGSAALDRLAEALRSRHAAGLGPVALVPCDNLPDNGALLRRVLTRSADAATREAIVANSFVSTVVDRITPASTPELVAMVRARTGTDDAMPVVTEPFREWVLAGEFPAGRPQWGATFVDDAAPYENRKLWLLNAGHSFLAYAGLARGYTTVAEAIGDPDLRGQVAAWWAEAGPYVGLPLEDYLAALLVRWDNPRIEHRLAQIAKDGSEKLRVRVVPVAEAALAAGREPVEAAAILAAWIRHLREQPQLVTDVNARVYLPLAASGRADDVATLCAWLGLETGERLAPLVLAALR